MNTNSIYVGVPSWTIQDGNYPEFERDNKYNFALSFSPKKILQPTTSTSNIRRLKVNSYQISGNVQFRDENIIVVNFGFLAYSKDHKLKSLNEKSYILAEIDIEIDPYDYKEKLYKSTCPYV